MYSELDRTWIRHFVGFGATFTQADPRTEAAITATQSTADGGSRPDSSGENIIKGLIYGTAAITSGTSGVTPGPTSTTGVTFNTPAVTGLIQIEAEIAALDYSLGATEADGGDAKVNVAREGARLKNEGRRRVNALCIALGLQGPRADVFGTIRSTGETAWPFWGDRSRIWP